MTNNEIIDSVCGIFDQYDGRILFGVQSLIFKSGLFSLEVDLKGNGYYPFFVNVDFGHNEGAGSPCVDLLDLKETIHHYMKRYHIKQKIQLSLFDFAY